MAAPLFSNSPPSITKREDAFTSRIARKKPADPGLARASGKTKGVRLMKDHEVHRELFERCFAHPLDGPVEKWDELVQTLALPPDHLEFALMVLHCGRWRKAADPLGYVRAAARRERLKQELRQCSRNPQSISQMNLPCDEDDVPMGPEEALDYMKSRSAEDEWETPYVQQRVRRELRGGEAWDDDAEHTINYSAVADELALRAGLTKKKRDAIEAVLRMRGNGLSRERILDCPPAERKRRQNAWKWLDLNNPLVRSVLSGKPC